MDRIYKNRNVIFENRPNNLLLLQEMLNTAISWEIKKGKRSK